MGAQFVDAHRVGDDGGIHPECPLGELNGGSGDSREAIKEAQVTTQTLAEDPCPPFAHATVGEDVEGCDDAHRVALDTARLANHPSREERGVRSLDVEHVVTLLGEMATQDRALGGTGSAKAVAVEGDAHI